MAPPKRQTQAGRVIHSGRVTKREPDAPTYQSVKRKRDGKIPPPATRTGPPKRARLNRGSAAPEPEPPRRTTVPTRSIRFRPSWHKLVGATLLAVGLALASGNDVMLLRPSPVLLPGGHNEFYLFAGFGSAAYSTWFFGWFDRTR